MTVLMQTDSLVPGSSLRPLLTASSITKSFAGVRALKQASIQLFQGEVHALIGENGAGKSTLDQNLAGALPADSGTLESRRANKLKNTPTEAPPRESAAIYQ